VSRAGSRALSPLGTARARLDPAAALPAGAAAVLDGADLGGEEAFLVWQLTAMAEGLTAADRQALARLLAVSVVAVAQGSTRVPLDAPDRELLARLPDLAGPPGSDRPLVVEGAHLYHHKHFRCEQRIAAQVRARLSADPPWPAAERQPAVDAAAGSARPALTDDQRQAVEAALGRRLTVISGPPGSGKTTIAVTLLRALVRLGVPAEAIALTAPTGKAANRLEEAVLSGLTAVGQGSPAPEDAALLAAPPAAATLHRLLGYSPGARAFAYHESSPLPHRVVIVDESSMVDLTMMDRLLRALAPDAVLILLGDADQLPSVEAGAVFRDLAPLGVRLARSHRQDPTGAAGQRLLHLAAAVQSGAPLPLTARASAADLAFEGAELVPATELPPLLERWHAERIAAAPALDELRAATLPLDRNGFPAAAQDRLDALHTHYQRFRLLAVTRGRPTGAVALNTWMHQRLGASGTAPIPGEPILMLRNDYERALWNGDQGLCVRVREEGRPPRTAAAFKVGDRWTAWHLESLADSLTLAYALTVHKAQGSEHDHIALILPDTLLPLTTRDLLYTALTRARRTVTLCASPPILTAATTHPTPRSSGLPERWKGPALSPLT
jgi:exodeoxyribonuclease V alpha subunit